MIMRVIIANLGCHKSARKTLQDRLIDLFGGFTCYKTIGGWRDDNGCTMTEPGICYEIATTFEPSVVPFLECAAAIGEQAIYRTISEDAASIIPVA